MADMHIEERCSCGASVTVDASAFRSAGGGGSAPNGSQRSAEEVAERWRLDHRHEVPRIAVPMGITYHANPETADSEADDRG